MFPIGNAYDIERERRQEESRQAIRAAIEVPTIPTRARSLPRYQRLIIYLGMRLEAWGCALQKRYDCAMQVTQPASHA